MNAVIYIRVSTEEQAKEGYSIPAQKERLEAFAKSQNWNIIEYYIEEGQSAKDLNRPEMQRLIRDIENNSIGIEVILVYRLDRLTRSVLDLYKLLKIFENKKVAFRSATEVYDTTTAMGRLFITLVAALAQWERENLAERVRMGMAEMARQGRRPGTKEPYGYNYIDGMLIVNQTEASIVKKIFDMYVRGYGVRQVVKWLNNENHPVPSKTNKPWTDTTVAYIITNPLYTGKFVWGRDVKDLKKTKNQLSIIPKEYIFDGSHEAIIDFETWEMVQFKLKRRRKLPPRHATGNFPLTGILVCGLCRGTMNGGNNTRTTKKGKIKTRYYKCNNKDHKQTCNMKYLKADEVENRVINHIEEIVTSDIYQAFINEALATKETPGNNTEIYELEDEIRELSAKKKKWFDAYEAGVIELRDLQERLKSIHDREMFLRDRITEVETPEDEPFWTEEQRFEKLKSFRSLWIKATMQERKELAHEIIREIVISPEMEINVSFV